MSGHDRTRAPDVVEVTQPLRSQLQDFFQTYPVHSLLPIHIPQTYESGSSQLDLVGSNFHKKKKWGRVRYAEYITVQAASSQPVKKWILARSKSALEGFDVVGSVRFPRSTNAVLAAVQPRTTP